MQMIWMVDDSWDFLRDWDGFFYLLSSYITVKLSCLYIHFHHSFIAIHIN